MNAAILYLAFANACSTTLPYPMAHEEWILYQQRPCASRFERITKVFGDMETCKQVLAFELSLNSAARGICVNSRIHNSTR